MGLLVWVLAFWQPNAEWQDLITARLAKQSAGLAHEVWMAENLSSEKKKAYLLTLGQIGNPQDARRIVTAFSDPTLQTTAVFAYGELEDAPTKPLIDLASQAGEEIVPLLLEALAKLGNEEDHPKITSIWEKAPAKIQDLALFSLWRQKPQAISSQVLKRLEQATTPDFPGHVYYLFRSQTKARAEVIQKVIRLYSADAQACIYASRIPVDGSEAPMEETFSSLLGNQDWRLRVQGIQGLSRMKSKQTASRGLLLLSDSNPNVRKAAMVALVGLGNAKVDQNITRFPQELSQSLRQTAVANATDSQTTEYWPLIKDWESSEDLWQRQKWLQLQGKSPDKNTVAILEERLAEPKSAQAVLALNALGARDHSKALGWVKHFFQSEDPFLLNAALGIMGTDEVHSWPVPLAEVTEKAQATFRENIFQHSYIQGLSKWMSPEAAATALNTLSQHEDYLVRYNAVKAMAQAEPSHWANVFSKPWNSPVPRSVPDLATQLLHTAKLWTLTLETSRGDVVIKLEPNLAPITCANIAYLASRSYWVGLPLHRVVPNFVVQMGDNRGDGSGGPGYEIPCEVNPLQYQRGAVGMALLSKDSGGGQFFICHSDQPHLNGGYTVFGRVIKGMQVVDTMEEGDTIRWARIGLDAGSEADLKAIQP